MTDLEPTPEEKDDMKKFIRKGKVTLFSSYQFVKEFYIEEECDILGGRLEELPSC